MCPHCYGSVALGSQPLSLGICFINRNGQLSNETISLFHQHRRYFPATARDFYPGISLIPFIGSGISSTTGYHADDSYTFDSSYHHWSLGAVRPPSRRGARRI